MNNAWGTFELHNHKELRGVLLLSAAIAGTYLVVQLLNSKAAGSKATDFSSFLKQPARDTGRHRPVRTAAPTVKQTDFAAFLKKTPAQPTVRSTSFAAFLRNAPAQEEDAEEEQAGVAQPAQQPQPAQIPIPVLYGTEYGFCREIAERLRDRLHAAQRYWAVLTDMADVPEGLDLCRYQVLLVICSTQGDGVPPSEARAFCDWLSTPAAPALHSACSAAGDEEQGPLAFAVLAAGDKSYINFCACGKMVDARLEALGATRIHGRTDLNREDWKTVDAWIAGVMTSLQGLSLRTFAELGGIDHLQGGEDDSAKPRRWGKSRPYWGQITAIDSLCAITCPDDRDTVRVEIDLRDSGLTYAPGDALGVYPYNESQAVQELLTHLGLQGTEPVGTPSWHYQDEHSHAADGLQLREALTKCYDLRSPRPQLLELLLSLAPAAIVTKLQNGHVPAPLRNGKSSEHQQPLQNGKRNADQSAVRQQLNKLLADEAAIEAYFTPRHVIDVLQDFLPQPLHQHQQRPADYPARLLSCLRPLLPRLYSISSSMLEAPDRVQITVAAVRYDSLGRPRTGVASNFLAAGCKVGDELPVYMHANPDFRLPDDDAIPLIMVGPGTGLAPFRSFVMERLLSRTQQPSDAAGSLAPSPYQSAGLKVSSQRHVQTPCSSTGDQQTHDKGTAHASEHAANGLRESGSGSNESSSSSSSRSTEASGTDGADCRDLLFFGCRRRNQDFLYRELLEGWDRDHVVKLHTAFSREQGHKVYVQQRLREAGGHVWRLLQQGAHVYVCGDAAYMAGDVERALLDIISGHEGDNAAAYLQDLQAAKRYQRDVWF